MKEKSHYHSGYGVQKKGKKLKNNGLISLLPRYCSISLVWFISLEKTLLENQNSKTIQSEYFFNQDNISEQKSLITIPVCRTWQRQVVWRNLVKITTAPPRKTPSVETAGQ